VIQAKVIILLDFGYSAQELYVSSRLTVRRKCIYTPDIDTGSKGRSISFPSKPNARIIKTYSLSIFFN